MDYFGDILIGEKEKLHAYGFAFILVVIMRIFEQNDYYHGGFILKLCDSYKVLEYASYDKEIKPSLHFEMKYLIRSSKSSHLEEASPLTKGSFLTRRYMFDSKLLQLGYIKE